MSTAYEQTLQSIASQVGNRREFLERFIDHAIDQYDALGGMFWDCSSPEAKPICQHYRGENMLKLGCSAQQHADFLRQACESTEPLLVSANKNSETQSESKEFPAILLVAVRHAGRTEVAELFFAADQPSENLTAKIGPLAALCQGASKHGMPSQPQMAAAQAGIQARESKNQISVSSTDAFIHSLHQSLDLKDNAKAISNETRRFLECDRATVVEVRGKRCRTIAISGQPSVNRRSNAVRQLEKVANRVLPTRQMFWYPAEDELPPQIHDPLQEYLANSATRTMVIVPVFDRVDSRQLQVDQTPDRKKLIGGIIVEHCREQWDREQLAPLVELATRHGSDAYRNSWSHQSLFLYGIWKWLGRSKIIFAARHLPKTIAAVTGILLATLALIFVPADFELTCNGSLIPAQRELVYPKSSGVIDEVLVDHGQKVLSGEPVVKMKDLNLDYQLAELKGQINEVQESIKSISSSRLGQKRDDDESLQRENLKSLKAQLTSLKEQQRIYLKRQEALVVTSPITGQVMTWEVKKHLKNRSVGVEGQLMEIANVDGKWILDLDLPDRKVGHFMKRWNEAREDDEPVNVEFILAAEPGVTHQGKVNSVGTSTQINAANEHHLRIRVDIDIESIDVRQSRSGVSAKIDCGKASLGYTWLHPIKEFFQSKVLFPYW